MAQRIGRSPVPVSPKTNFSIMFTLPVKSTGELSRIRIDLQKSNTCGVSNTRPFLELVLKLIPLLLRCYNKFSSHPILHPLSQITLRSSSSLSICVPTRKTAMATLKSFSSVASNIWNALPNHLSSIPTLLVFRRALKHHLFLLAYLDSSAKSSEFKPVQCITLCDTTPISVFAQKYQAVQLKAIHLSAYIPTQRPPSSSTLHHYTTPVLTNCIYIYIYIYIYIILYINKRKLFMYTDSVHRWKGMGVDSPWCGLGRGYMQHAVMG